MPQPRGARKPLRAGLWGPFAIAIVSVVAWSSAWLFAAREVDRRLDDTLRGLSTRGVKAEWSERRLAGYPFRLNLVMTDLRLSAGDWRLRIPDFEAQAYLHAPRSWLAAAPAGLVVHRPEGGDLEVQGDRLLASLVLPKAGPPRLSVEGLGLRFSPSAGARPFALESAGRMELHVRPGPDDQAAVFIRLEDGTATPGRLLADLGGGATAAATLEGRLEHASRLRGAALPDALAAWGASGGKLEILQAGMTVGKTRVALSSPGLGAGPEGRLNGRVTVTAAGTPALLLTLARHGVVSPPEAAGGLAAALLSGAKSRDDVRLYLELADGKVRLARRD